MYITYNSKNMPLEDASQLLDNVFSSTDEETGVNFFENDLTGDILKRVDAMNYYCSETLNLSDLGLTKMPDFESIIDVDTCEKIKTLILSKNKIKFVCNLRVFKNVKFINLKSNEIAVFDPVTFPESCEKINLSHNLIKSTCDYVYSGIKKLNLKNNQLVNKSLLSIANLEMLNLKNNNYTNIDDCLPISLTSLICSHNNLLSFNDIRYTLIELDLSHNRITDISLNYLYSNINLSNNEICGFDAINLSVLDELDLSNNLLDMMPQHLPETLKKLYINDNQIKVICHIPECLTHLNAENNCLDDVDLRNSINLKNINLANNNLLEIPEFHYDTALDSIVINLKNNHIKNIVNCENISKIKKIHLDTYRVKFTGDLAAKELCKGKLVKNEQKPKIHHSPFQNFNFQNFNIPYATYQHDLDVNFIPLKKTITL